VGYRMRQRTSPIWLLEESKFKLLIQESYTTVEVLSYFNMHNKGRNFVTLKQRIDELGLDTSHFCPHKNRNSKRYSEKEYFVENSTIVRKTIKNRVIKEKLVTYECFACKNTGTWNNKKLSLQLEHKNGISNDNRIENLCFLCPNCHSQTETYAGKNTRKK
jgi:hypothetical protein